VRKTKKLLRAAVFGGALLAAVTTAHATMQLFVSDGTNSFTVSDSNNDGQIFFSQSFGSVTTSINVGLSKPLLPAGSGDSNMHLTTIDVVTTGGVTLTVKLSDQDFSGDSSSTFSSAVGGVLSAAAGSSVTSSVLVDVNNTLFAGAQLCTPNASFGPGAFSSTCGGSLPTDNQYSITLADVISFTGAGSVSVDHAVYIPEPSAMLLLGAGLIGLAAWGRRQFNKRNSK
jgi:PEP-CTERM motif-containing protein